ncbi:MAG: hypothetical protein HOB73_12480 [Planctomycetaceae bacterium]|nr:hypothetical protein [Planctomycetaceae bacterium]
MTAEKTKKRRVPKQPIHARSASHVRVYSEHALLTNQPRLTDLIPLSRWAYVAMLLVGVGVIYLLQLGAMHASIESNSLPLELFALNGPGTLASWVSSVLLLLLCVGSIQVYLIRRFKADDYKGRYKIWLWVAIIAAVLSFEQATGAHRLLQSVADRFATAAPWNQASMWWTMIVSVVATYVGIRLFFELTSNMGSFALFVLTAVGYGMVACSRLESVLGASYLTSAEGQSVSLLGANVLMTTLVWLYARTVYLSAQGGRQAAMISSALDHEFGVAAINITDTTMVAVDEAIVVKDDFEEPEIASDEELDAELDAEDWDDFDEVDEAVEEEVDFVEYESDASEEDENAEYEEQEDENEHEGYEDALEQEMQAEYAESLAAKNDAEIDPGDYADAGEYADAMEAAAHESSITPAFASSVQGVAEGDGFDEDAFWSGYDLTKMSRKQLRKMRKKLTRLKRQHAGQPNSRAA